VKDGSGITYVPLSFLSVVVVDEPSGFWWVVFFSEEEKAPERAPRIFRFRPA
jgi:hypothetical protein